MHCATTAQARKWFAEITVHVSNMENGLTHLYRKERVHLVLGLGWLRPMFMGKEKKIPSVEGTF